VTEPVIRPARRRDAPAILRCLAALSAQDGADHAATAEDYRSHGFGRNRLFHTLVAEDGGEVVGVAVFFPTFSTQRGTPGIYVQDLWLAPEMRGRGLGRRLLAAVRAHGDRWGADHILLMVARRNAAAARFYARNGFRRLTTYDTLVLDGPDYATLEAQP
jgi:GNAT superfamily N-acetyltransferase